MPEMWSVLVNWIALLAAGVVIVVVFRYTTMPILASQLTIGSFSLGVFEWIFKIPLAFLNQILLSFVLPIMIVISLQAGLWGIKTAGKFPAGQLISESGLSTKIFVEDIFFSLTGQEGKIQNRKFRLIPEDWDPFASEGNETSLPEVLPSEEVVTPTSLPEEETVVTPIPKDWNESLRKVSAMACVVDGPWAVQNFPPGEYYIFETSNWGTEFQIQVLSGPWQNQQFCLTKSATRNLSADGKAMGKGQIFQIP